MYYKVHADLDDRVKKGDVLIIGTCSDVVINDPALYLIDGKFCLVRHPADGLLVGKVIKQLIRY